MLVMNQNRRPSRPLSSRAFTLIELLVVMAIIAALMSIIQPSLQRGIDLGRRVGCAGNQHGIYVAYTVFSGDFKGHIPLGYAGNAPVKQGSYDIRRDGREVNFGTLYKEECLDGVTLFYCPAQKNPQFMFNSAKNKWPGRRSRASYNSRPEFHWQKKGSGAYGPSDYMALPQLENFLPTQTLVSDLVRMGSDLATVHKGEGINLLKADGSVQWRAVDDGAFAAIAATIYSQGSRWNTLYDELWAEYDAR